VDYFARLGAALEDAWGEHRREEEHFPDAALEVLARLPPAEALDRDALLDHLLDLHRPALLPLAPLGAFGQPGFTVHRGHGFVVELYHWIESLSAIHNHPFCGAFTIVHGHSVHARYHVGDVEPLGGRAQRVSLRLEGLDLLTEGDVVPFSLHRHPLVHALIHVPRSSISMVVRTVRTEGYYRYLPPSLALPMEGTAPPRDRQLALLEALDAVGDPSLPQRLGRLLDHADYELALRLLSAYWPGHTPTEREAAIERARARLGDAASLLTPALDRALILQQTTSVRESLTDPALRLVAVALGYAEQRDQVMALLSARGLDPLATLHRFVDETGMFEGDEQASALIAHVLIDGGDASAAIERLRSAYGAEAVAGHETEVVEFCEGSMFSVLRRSSHAGG